MAFDAHSSCGSNLNKMTITALIVDDDENDISVFIQLLEKYGFQTTLVNDGGQAINLLNSGKQFDVIFVETKPSLNGLQATRHLRDIEVRSLIIGIEIRTSRNDYIAFRRSGMDRFYEKPVSDVVVALLYNEIKMKKIATGNMEE